jgi:hypothetical protein
MTRLVTTALARIRTASSPSATSTPYVSDQVNQRLDTAATGRSPRVNSYSRSRKSPFASRSSGPGTSTVKRQWMSENSSFFTTAASLPLRWISYVFPHVNTFSLMNASSFPFMSWNES